MATAACALVEVCCCAQQAEEEQKEAERQAKAEAKRAALETKAAQRAEEARKRQEFRQETHKVGNDVTGHYASLNSLLKTISWAHYASLDSTLIVPSLRGLGRLWFIRGRPLTEPHGMIETPHGIDFSFSCMV